MSWLQAPVTHEENLLWDEDWGLHLILDSDDSRDKQTAIFGVCDDMFDHFKSKDEVKRLFGKDRELFACCNNGTAVRQR